ncbi:protein phosphatase 1 regulatory subunit 26-like [Tiliqua scincoides]|uniref:protein phosphatase 1 regulatory subunit 26-like n=1 Tax=Tiliqua scincoides TaxID=71010 RepID=UPI003461B62D
MFLMESPPLVALQRNWEPFSPSRSCRYPICFSESEDDIARTTVSAQVQMIISNLQSEESPLGSGQDYGCIAQKGTKGGGRKLRGSGRALQERMAYGQRHYPADSDGMEVEEGSEFGPLSLHSDSDDSVDRDIEEAIQEYLRNKGQDIQRLPGSAKSLHGADGGQRIQQEHPPRDAACDLFPANVKAEVVQQRLAPGYLGDGTAQRAASPCSTSSDDSFEQSIKAEIEQFLIEKKQREREMQLSREGKRLDPKEAPESLALRSQKEGAKCPRRGSARPLCGSGKPTDSQKASQTHPGTAVAGHSSAPEQSKEGKVGPKRWETQKAVVSDSSSDDGIEEAIQLYQLEKLKKEANSQTSRAAFLKDAFQAGGVVDISTSLTIRSEKSALPGAPRKARVKQHASQPVEPSRLGAARDEPEKGRCCAPAANCFASCAVTSQASCRADTELMCAEAILDISKAILPPPTVSDNRSLTTDPFRSQVTPPSRQESDNTAVDSDDSIEQEIRAFLAAKARAERLAAKSEGNRRAVQGPPFSGQPGESRRPKQSVCRKRQLSLRRKKNLKRVTGQIQDKAETPSEVGRSPEDRLKQFACQCQGAASILGDTREVDGCRHDALATVSSVHLADPLRSTEGRVQSVTRASQKCGTGDKSSSLDSDEDLDTALKDLLRSKRKWRKKPKGQRVQCKKRVKFGDTKVHVLEDELSGSPERDCNPRTAPLPRVSCLTRSPVGVREEGTKSRPRTVVKAKPKSAKAVPLALECKEEGQPKSVSAPDNRDAGGNNQSPRPATALTDDTSSVDSDDSIEQEIRKFLAEKAKDSTSATEANKTVEPLGVVEPQIAPLRARRLLWQTEDNTLLKRRKKVKKVGPPTTESRSRAQKAAGDSPCEGNRMLGHVEEVGSQPPGKLQTNQGIVQAESAGSRTKRPVVDHRAVSDSKLARGNLGAPDAGDRKLQKYIKPLSSRKRKNPQKLKISSKFIASLKSARSKKTSVPVGKRQDLKVLEREGGVLAASGLSERCDAALTKPVLGSRSEAGVREAGLATAEKLQPCAPESPGNIRAPPLNNEAVGLVNPALSNTAASQGPPLQAPDAGSIRGAKVSTGPLHLEEPVEEKEGRTRGLDSGWEECRGPSAPSCLPPKENALTGPDRLAGRQAQEVLEGGSAEFTDGPVAEQASCLGESKPSSFFLRTSIDPGWRVLPYIVLSPTQLLASKALAVQGRRRALQVLGEKLGAGWNSRMLTLAEQ